MASIVKDPRRGTWAIQWFNGKSRVREVVMKKRPGWREGQPMPKKAPPEVQALLAEYHKKEQAAKRLGQDRDPDATVADFLAAHLEGYKLGHADGSAHELTKVIEVFRGWCEANKVVKLDTVTAAVCNRWLEHRARTISQCTGKPIAYSTLKKERAYIATAWGAAYRLGRVESNPWIAVDVPGSPERKKKGSWSPDEFELLISHCKPWLQDLLIVGCHTGFRIGALRGLEWSDVHWNTNLNKEGFGFLEVRQPLDKGGKGYIVPIHPRVHDVLARRLIHRVDGVDAILTGKYGKPIRSTSTTAKAIRRICDEIGLPVPSSPNHHMRRTFGRWAVLGHLNKRPVPMYVVSRWMGHASVKMTETYLDLKHDDSTSYMLGHDVADQMTG